MTSKPQLLCWVMCDGVHLDPSTGKHTLLGIFANLRGHRFPVVQPFMIWFLTITDVAPGEHRIRISFGLDPTQLQGLIDRPFRSKGPLDRINLINELRHLTFAQPGDYTILIEIDEEPLLMTSLIVTG